MSQNEFTKTQAALVKAVYMLCRPLIRLLIEKGITFPQFREMMKELYVDVADSQFALEGKKTSDSRIFVLTGIHRKDIKRIRQQAEEDRSSFNSIASLGGEIIARWNSMPEYLDDTGKPRALLRSGDDKVPGFEQLVTGINKDVRPRAILDEWLRLDIVTMDEEYVVLNKSAFISNKAFNEMAYYLGHNVHDHVASCVNNILNENEPMLERSVYYASLTEDSVNSLRDMASQQGNELLQTLNKKAVKLYDSDKQNEDANYRMRLGVYWYQEHLDADSGTGATQKNEVIKK